MVGENLKKLSGGILLFTALVFFSFAQGLVDRVVASVNGDPILESDVKLGMLFYNTTDRREVISRLVDVWLINQFLQGKGVGVQEELLDQALIKIAQANNMSLERLQNELQKEGLTLRDLKEFLRKELLFSQGIYAVLLREVNVSALDLELEKLKRGQVEVKRLVEVLVVDKKDGERLMRALEKTKDLRELAKTLGLEVETLLVKKGELVESLDKEVWNAKVGDLVFGEDKEHVYVAKVLEVKEEYKGKPLEELKEELLEKKLEERKKELLQNLRKRSFIRIMG
ncbi:SurA domain-containing protein [Thermocrinis ruber]|uniref:SurA domain-containing protein n=1 Tax=Thermocrinis ruber TaxID=75906 RepID=W0DI00_9AQUI|nr:peptidylprolyl isomerase [Thermocrinis ruber]AHE96872.1 SurA domain-containing protein [Thermocrinis ruber]